MTEVEQRLVRARAVRRRLADMRKMREYEDRGWTCIPPEDDIQRYVEQREDAR